MENYPRVYKANTNPVIKQVEEFIDFNNSKLGNQALPHNKEAELNVLRGLLGWSGEFMGEVKKIITANDFYEEKHKIIYEVIENVVEKIDTIDFSILTQELEKLNKFDYVGGEKFISKLMKFIPSKNVVIYNAHAIYESACERKALIITAKLYNSIVNKENIVDVIYNTIHEYENIVSESQSFTLTPQKLADAAEEEIIKRMKKEHLVDSLFTGWSNVEKITGGFEKGDVVIIAGRTSMGKSHTVLQLHKKWSVEQNIPGAYFTLEMKPVQLAFRSAQLDTGISSKRIKDGEISDFELELIKKSNDNLRKSQFYTEMQPGMTISKFRFRVKELKKRYGIKYAIIDHVGLMNTDKPMTSKEQEQRKISNDLKKIALEFDLIIIEILQLNRDTTSNKDKRPTLSNLRQSGAFEEDADTIILLHRPNYYGDKTIEIDGVSYPSKNITEAIVGKSRNGEGTGSAFLYSKDSSNKLEDINFNLLNTSIQHKGREEMSDAERKRIDNYLKSL